MVLSQTNTSCQQAIAQITADFTLMKYTRQAIDRCRETARRRVLYLCYVPHLPKKYYKSALLKAGVNL